MCCRFVAESSPDDGLPLNWPDGDRTPIQVDQSTICPTNPNQEIMTMYRYLVLLERQNKITTHDVSYTSVERNSAGGETDGFVVKPGATPHKFKMILDTSKPATCKTWFGDSVKRVQESVVVQPVFRFRFERVNGHSKVQKPYVMTRGCINCEVGKPIQAGVFHGSIALCLPDLWMKTGQ